MRGRDGLALQQFEFEAAVGDLAALAPDFLATLGREPGEEVVEIGVARVVPVVLAALPSQQFRALQQGQLGVLRKETVPGRGVELPGERLRAEDELFRDRAGVGAVVVDEQAPAADRRERYRGDQLRVVPAAGTLVGVGPAVIEDEFALRVVPGIEGQGADEAVVPPCEQVLRIPAVRFEAAMAFKAGEELVAQERITGAGERVPLGGGDLLQAGDDFEALDSGRLRSLQGFGSGAPVKTGKGVTFSPRPLASVILLGPVFSTSSTRITACIGM